MAPARRQPHLETMRGIACLLLVAYHVIGNDVIHGMHVADGTPWRFLTELFVDIRMPMFAFISGYVFSANPQTLADLGGALVKKLRRLFLPLISVSTLFYLASTLILGQEPMAFSEIFYLPYEHFWYLQATILIMAGLLTAALVAGGGRRAALILLAPIALASLLIEPWSFDLFSSAQALYLAPYFLAGQVVRGYGLEAPVATPSPRRTVTLMLLGGGTLCLLALQAAVLFDAVDLDFGRQAPLGMVLGLGACLFLLILRLDVEALAWIGTRSYPIYLFHVFFTAGARIAMQRLDPNPDPFEMFVIGLIAGIVMPILLSSLLMRHPLTALVFLGVDLSPRRRRDGQPASQPAAAE